MPNAGVVSMVVSPVARRRNLLLCACRRRFQRGPGLARRWDELPLVGADQTRGGLSFGGRILRAARRTDESCHEGSINLSLAPWHQARLVPDGSLGTGGGKGSPAEPAARSVRAERVRSASDPKGI